MLAPDVLRKLRLEASLAGMKSAVILASILAGLAGAWAGWSAKGFFAVDACLDAGSRWEARGSYCEALRA
jgi:hypothetical protein